MPALFFLKFMSEDSKKLDISDEMIAERRGGTGKMPDDMPSWMAKSIIQIDKFSKIIVANWKMNGSIRFIDNFFEKIAFKYINLSNKRNFKYISRC